MDFMFSASKWVFMFSLMSNINISSAYNIIDRYSTYLVWELVEVI